MNMGDSFQGTFGMMNIGHDEHEGLILECCFFLLIVQFERARAFE